MDEITSTTGMVILDQILFAEVSETYDQIKELEHSLEIYEAIADTIIKCGGVTKSLEVMFGENFSSAASMEGETLDKVKEIASKAIEKLKEFFSKLWDWFKRIFSSNDRLIKNLHTAENNADKVTFPINVKFTPHISEFDTWMKQFSEKIELVYNDDPEKGEVDVSLNVKLDPPDTSKFEVTTIDSAEEFKQACVNAAALLGQLNDLFKRCDSTKNRVNSLMNEISQGTDSKIINARKKVVSAAAKLMSALSKFANKTSRAIAFELLQPKTVKNEETKENTEANNK